MTGEERREAIVGLLRTRDDHLPTSSRTLTPTPPRGFVGGLDEKGQPLRWVSCPDCLANDVGIGGKQRATRGCETCGGSGQLPDVGPDPYAKNEQVLPFGFDATRHDTARARDREIETLARQTRPAPTEAELLDEANRRGYGWEEERRTMYRRFDYAALDQALDALRIADDGAYHALHIVFVYDWVTVPNATLEDACERGLRFLDENLPDPLRAPGFEQKHPALVRRDRKHQGKAAA